MVIVTFYFYDLFVQKRNHHLVDQAARSNAIVTSLFPGTLRDKVLDQRSHDERAKRQGTTSEMKSFLSTNTSGVSGSLADTTKPLAEFFPAVTVMFAVSKLWNSILVVQYTQIGIVDTHYILSTVFLKGHCWVHCLGFC